MCACEISEREKEREKKRDGAAECESPAINNSKNFDNNADRIKIDNIGAGDEFAANKIADFSTSRKLSQCSKQVNFI